MSGSKNNRARGAKYENDIAKILGGKRHWANSGGQEDVSHERYAIQCKSGERIWNQTLRNGVASAVAAAGSTGKLPLLVVIDRAGTRLKRYAVIQLEDFCDWEGIKPSDPEQL
jgi:hypothetical protein